jgi:hypothetical protein
MSLPAVIHDVLHPFERCVGPELQLLNDLLSGQFRVPLPELPNADSIGGSVIEIPPDPGVHGTSPRGIPATFLEQCISPSDPKRVRGSQVGDDLFAREIGA